MVAGNGRLGEPVEVLLQFRRQRRVDIDPLAGDRVRERKPRRVQELTTKCRLGDSVDAVSDDGQVDRREVNADLMHPSRLKPHPQQRVTIPGLSDLEVRDRIPRRICLERNAGGVMSIAADRSLDPSAPRCRPSLDEREVCPLECATANEGREELVGLFGPRNDEESRGIAVETVNDPGPAGLPAGDDPDERVDKRPVRTAGAWMNDETGRLVDDGDVIVLPDDLCWRPRRASRNRRGLDCGKGDRLASDAAIALWPRPTVDKRAVLDGLLSQGPRSELAGEEAVEALAGCLARDAEETVAGAVSHLVGRASVDERMLSLPHEGAAGPRRPRTGRRCSTRPLASRDIKVAP
jgi:hypothetical protein